LEISKNIRDYVIKVLTDLISIPTINPPGKDYETCANYLSDELIKIIILYKCIIEKILKSRN